MSKTKKIIFSCFDDLKNPNYGGGGAYAVHQISKRLAKNHQVTVITGSYRGSVDETIDGVDYKRIGISKFGGRFGQLIYQIILPYYVLTKKFDIWFENFTPPISTGFLPLFTNDIVIGIANLLAAKDMSKKYWGIPFHWFEKFGLRYYKNVIVLTRFLKEKLNKEYLDMNVVVIPNAVDDAYIKYNLQKKNGEHILFIGRIDIEQKGIDILLDAYKRVETVIRKKMIIAGSGSEKEVKNLKNKIKTLGLNEKVDYVGWVTGEEKIDLFKNAAYMVLPSRFEEFGIVVLESFCFETPVIASDLPQLSWIPKEGVVKVEPENTDKLADEMLKMSLQISKRSKMGKKAKQSVEQYSWDRSVKLYEEIIKKTKKYQHNNNFVTFLFRSFA